MGERRNRKSLWDNVEETRHPLGMGERDSWAGNDRHSRHNSAPKSGDHLGWPSWDSIEENPMGDSFIRNRQNASEGKDIGGESRYYKNESPGFDGIERHNYDRPPENDRSRPQRYQGRGRSRSRSRSRTRGRSRSRSGSLSRGKGRERGRGWTRSRSRSRSRSGGSVGGYARSRSPVGDSRRQPYGWSERTSGPDKSSQICRDFATGRCRRGSQCRFFHPDDVSRRDEGLIEGDGGDAWKYRADHVRVPKQSYSRSHGRDDVTDPYHREDAQFQNKSRNMVPCKDFIKGNCRWGDNCRFSHHFTADDSLDKGTGHASFDDNNESQANKYVKPLCKYFAAGKCDRDNCRFSHDNPKLTNLEVRRSEVPDNPRLHDKSNRWSGPNWDDVTRVSDTLKPSRWSETVVTSLAGTNDTTNGNGDDKRANIVEDDPWALPEWTGNSVIQEQRHSPPREMGSYGGGLANTQSFGKDNMSSEKHIILHHPQLKQDGTSSVQGYNTIPEEQTFSMKTLPQTVSPASHLQPQHHGMVENIPVNSFGSTVLDEVNSRNTRLPIIFSGQNLNQKRESMFAGHPSSSQGTDRVGGSNGFSTELNGTETHTITPLDLHAQMQKNLEAIQPLIMSELNALQSFPYSGTSDQFTMTKSPVAFTGQQVSPATKPTQFLTQRFVNEQSQAYTGVEISNSKDMAPSFSSASAHVPFVGANNAQPRPDSVSLGLLNATDDGSENENHNSTGGTEMNVLMHVDQSSLPTVVGTVPSNSKPKHQESPKRKQEDLITDSEVNRGNDGNAEETKGVQENKGPSLDGQGKVEDSTANKDNKGMRVFKNALIEFVKELLKPKWKEGRMSREAHKNIVKKVVDKVTTTIQVDHIPKTLDKVELYLSNSKPKIAKLVEAYADRCQKTDPVNQ